MTDSILQIKPDATPYQLYDTIIFRIQAVKGALDSYPTYDEQPNPPANTFSPLFCGASTQLEEVEAMLEQMFKHTFLKP